MSANVATVITQPDGRHYPWYLSLTDREENFPVDSDKVEQLILSLFGVPSETTRARERRKRLKDLEEQRDNISKRLEVSKAEERRLRREFEFNKRAWELRTFKALEQGEQALSLLQALKVNLNSN